MSKRTIYSVVTPLPPTVTRQLAVDMLHSHGEMVELGPYVIEHHEIPPPKDAPTEEYHCAWRSITDRLPFLPGGLATGKVTYNVCFHNLPYGMQSHCYASMGVHIRNKWTVAGNMPGEPREVMELGVPGGAPRDGLYLREDIDIKCNVLMTGYVKRMLKNAHEVLVARMLKKGELIEDDRQRMEFSQNPVGYRNSTYKPPLRSISSSMAPNSPTASLKSTSSPIIRNSSPLPPPPVNMIPDSLKPGRPDSARRHSHHTSLASHTLQSGPAELPAELPSEAVESSNGPSARSSLAPGHHEIPGSPVVVSPLASPAFNQMEFPDRRSYGGYHDGGSGSNHLLLPS